MAGRWPGDKPLFEAMMVSLLTHICVARSQWVKHLPLMRHCKLEKKNIALRCGSGSLILTEYMKECKSENETALLVIKLWSMVILKWYRYAQILHGGNCSCSIFCGNQCIEMKNNIDDVIFKNTKYPISEALAMIEPGLKLKVPVCMRRWFRAILEYFHC